MDNRYNIAADGPGPRRRRGIYQAWAGEFHAEEVSA